MQCDVDSNSETKSSTSSSDFVVGSRVESNCGRDGTWQIYTLIATDCDSGSILVSDEGMVVPGVQPSQIRHPKPPPGGSSGSESAARFPGWSREDRAAFDSAFPFMASRQSAGRSRGGRSESQPSSEGNIIKRNWSALALVDAAKPVDLKLPDSEKVAPTDDPSRGVLEFQVCIVNTDIELAVESSVIESPPRLLVKLSLEEKLPGVHFDPEQDVTLVGALSQLDRLHTKGSERGPGRKCRLYFSVETEVCSPDMKLSALKPKSLSLPMSSKDDGGVSPSLSQVLSSRRKLSSRSLSIDGPEESTTELCDGFGSVAVQCMEVIHLISEYAEDEPARSDGDLPSASLFSNLSLSKRLSEQLDMALVVIGQCLPEWCMIAPSFTPRVFSYESRRMLLERAAFGVSRSTLKQQEAKVNVGRLRQRMASLRARAVELVGEAFSGGAEDPTALQLQADELYGMEEALASRVRASFRAEKWEEKVLQVAKAVVRRKSLLADADSIMERYSSDSRVRRRRLEVRFDGESGFDAASGTEAGVTRGFYADVAESLLSSENVSGVYCGTSCSYPTAVAAKLQGIEVEELTLKVPLWIPDMDASSQVVIPTPRFDERSHPGVYPRPLAKYDPQMPDVLRRFRFIGRLFASAMRDGFMFPLPLSASFLKLIQHGVDDGASGDCKASSLDTVLTSADLPRPGFLGGEIAAAEQYVCRQLDAVDAINPPLSGFDLERRYKEISSDSRFARVALGKSFDCSFEDYFQDRTFVDPLDPGQGDEAVPLCPKGHRKPVTIYNVREWVSLAKNFVLQDGVIAQAVAFRQGIEDFFSVSYLRLFTPEELQRDVCGEGDSVDSWDESAVRKLFKLDGKYRVGRNVCFVSFNPALNPCLPFLLSRRERHGRGARCRRGNWRRGRRCT